MPMHADEFLIDEVLIGRLLSEQAPQWSNLPIRRLASSGTDNAIFRLGDHLALRIPKRPTAVALLAKELDWLPHFQGLPLQVPVLRFRGRADIWPDCEFGIFDWVEGKIASPHNIADAGIAARDLARFLKALHEKDIAGAPAAGELNSRRGVALDLLSTATRQSIDVLADEIDARGTHALWEEACLTRGQKTPVWLHGDLKADNLITRDGVLHGVIDWGLSAVGDPAADYATAWVWVEPSARAEFQATLDVDDEAWVRAKGWALYGAVIALSYYRGGKNDSLCRQCRLTLSRLGLLP